LAPHPAIWQKSQSKMLHFALLIISSLFYITNSQNCGVTCQTNNDCRGDQICNMCRLGACTSGGNCRDYCNTNQDCYATWCNTCMNHSCKVSCRERCVNHDDCGFPCNQCMQGVCQIAGCGAKCTDWRDCITPGCQQCYQGVCKRGGCGAECVVGHDCYGQGNCTTCTDLRGPIKRYTQQQAACTSRCGSPCGSHAECFGEYTNCGQCDGWICQTANACGMRCVDNTGCSRSTTCRRCNKQTAMCDAGGGCGEHCETNNDCNQSSPDCRGCVGGVCGRGIN